MTPGHTNEGMDHLNLYWEDPPKMGRRREGSKNQIKHKPGSFSNDL
jgi:hypothetical protein